MNKRKNWVDIVASDWDYHRSLSQSEMAERGGVSKMAVSKAINNSMKNYFLVLWDELYPEFTILEIIKSFAKLAKIHSKEDLHNFVLTLPGIILALLQEECGMKITEEHSRKMYRKVNGKG